MKTHFPSYTLLTLIFLTLTAHNGVLMSPIHEKRTDSTCPQTLTPLSNDSKKIIGYFPGYLSDYTRYGSSYYDNNYNYVSPSSIHWNITHLNWIAFGLDDVSNKNIPPTSKHVFLNRAIAYRNTNRIPVKIFLAIVLSGNININSNPSFANGTSDDRAGFITNVINFVRNYNLDGVDIEYPNRFNCGTWSNDKNFVPLINELSAALKSINKDLSITVGPIPIAGLNPDSVNFVNVMTTQINIINSLTTPTNKTGPSITLDQTAAIMNNWSKTINPAKLNLGVDFYGVIELTALVDLGSLDNNKIIPRNLTTAPFATSYSSDPSDYLFYDKCTFTLDKSIQLYPWYFMRQQTGPLINTCTAGNGWTRKFDSETSTTYLYKVSSDSQVINSTTPVYEYNYISYEDPQSIQYKLKLITNNSYGGIAISDLYDDSSDAEMLNVIMSVFPVSYRNTSNSSSLSGSSSITIITIITIIAIIVAVIVFLCCCCACYKCNQKEVWMESTYSYIKNRRAS
ncbi:Glycoside Hydrolase Family 18 protein [Gigaspora rosea]|uniref:Glycoside Hydrolase Family 18 protein n=1 Tax=Gigaspora rosea TaxID=44941 RepID=A0A397VZJ0_9GLOM|nr:Glycoside Hydrolase Family 18 protein [Gigaspora rosea]